MKMKMLAICSKKRGFWTNYGVFVVFLQISHMIFTSNPRFQEMMDIKGPSRQSWFPTICIRLAPFLVLFCYLE